LNMNNKMPASPHDSRRSTMQSGYNRQGGERMELNVKNPN